MSNKNEGDKRMDLMSENDLGRFLELEVAKDPTNGSMGPKLEDLYSLYKRVREEKVLAVLEFGSGWSTLILAKALDENKKNFGHLVDKKVRHPNPFEILTVDASSAFLAIAQERVSRLKFDVILTPVVSNVSMSLVNGQVCSLFESIPPFTADFVYLDGPACDQVDGNIRGMNLKFGEGDYGLPMQADLICLEPYFWPGSTIVTDGRGANAYFLKNNFRRNWVHSYDKAVDQHVFRLDEEPWGGISDSLLKLKYGKS